MSLEEYSVHVVAGVLKLFFRQLAPPIIAADFYMDFIRTAGQFNWSLNVALCVLVSLSLPLSCSCNTSHLSVLSYLAHECK